MMLQNKELQSIEGGAFTAALFNAIVNGFEGLFKLGQVLGSALSRFKSGKKC